jgi:hypothetical protein
MHDSGCVGASQGVGDSGEEIAEVGRGEDRAPSLLTGDAGPGRKGRSFGARLLDTSGQRFAFDVFQDQERESFVLTNFVDGADVGILQARYGSGFALEPFHSNLAGAFMNELDRHPPAELEIFGKVDLALPSCTQKSE